MNSTYLLPTLSLLRCDSALKSPWRAQIPSPYNNHCKGRAKPKSEVRRALHPPNPKRLWRQQEVQLPLPLPLSAISVSRILIPIIIRKIRIPMVLAGNPWRLGSRLLLMHRPNRKINQNIHLHRRRAVQIYSSVQTAYRRAI